MTDRPASSSVKLSLICILSICAAATSSRGAVDTNAVLWTGAITNFTQSDDVPDDVLIPGVVVLTRNFSQCLFNSVTEASAEPGSPADCEWAFDPGGSLTDATNTSKHLTFKPLYSWRNFNLSGLLVPNNTPPGPFMIVHMTNEDIYFSVQFLAWPHGGGFFSYLRSTPAAVAPPPPPPTPSVGITNPVNNATFAAPADVNILVGATVSSGAVTNVSFFVNGTRVGSTIGEPFAITADGLSAGPYALTAVATAAGISATSSVVSISVVNPVTTSLAPASAANNNNQFSFNYSVNPGLTYVVESSPNLINWTPVATNVASGDPASFSTDIVGGDTYYRVGRLPNP